MTNEGRGIPGGLLFYDGDCPFCRRSVERWVRRTGGRLRAFPFRERPDLFPELVAGRTPGGVCFLPPEGAMLKGADAALAAWRAAGPFRWLAAALGPIPGFRPLAGAIYRIIAANRFRLSGPGCDGGACGAGTNGIPPR
jgi:predicted DCC family thiol-disulfide oxidoreductase YuxK